VNPIKIQLLLDGAQQVSAQLGKLVNDAQRSFSGMSQAGQASSAGMAAAEKAVAALSARIDLSSRAYERLRQSGKLTAEQLAKVQGLRDARNAPREQLRSSLQEQAGQVRLDDARQSLGVRPFAGIAAEVAKVNQAYATLATSGKLTNAELLQASMHQQQAVAELNGKANGWAQSLSTVRAEFARLASEMSVAFKMTAGKPAGVG
jgi:chromosome segregation ATPase